MALRISMKIFAHVDGIAFIFAKREFFSRILFELIELSVN